MLMSYAIPAVLLARGLAGPWILLPFASLPVAVAFSVQLARREGAPLNATLIGTARLLVLYGGLFVAGLVIA